MQAQVYPTIHIKYVMAIINSNGFIADEPTSKVGNPGVKEQEEPAEKQQELDNVVAQEAMP